MTIEEAEKMIEEGHKLTHWLFDNKEFVFMENDILKDEGGHHWGDFFDEPWIMRKKEKNFKDGWEICDDRPMINPITKQPIMIPKYVENYIKKEFVKNAMNSGNNIIVAGHPRKMDIPKEFQINISNVAKSLEEPILNRAQRRKNGKYKKFGK